MDIGRRQFLLGTVGMAGTLAVPRAAWAAPASSAGLVRHHAADAAVSWLSTTYDLVRRENLSPPAAARVYAHTAVAMYQAVLAGMPDRRSLSHALAGLSAPPHPRGREHVDWPSALITAAADVQRGLLPFAADSTRPALDGAEAAALSSRRRQAPGSRVDAGIAHGRAVAHGLVSWGAGDGYAGTVGRAYTPRTDAPWRWQSTPPNYRPAIEPYFSEVRPMVLRSADEVVPAPHLPYSEEPGSDFWQQALAPYEQSKRNGDEERAIARFWTDNPGSFTPPTGTPTGLPAGHWMLIATQALAMRRARLDLAVETLALTGVALHEAFLNCWTWKYRFDLLRPITYVQRHIDPTWTTFVNTPQFPEYTSGHSVASPAAAQVLTAQLGAFPFTDRSHEDRQPARSFSSFDDAAAEAAQSRLYGGIHYPMAIANGLDQGRDIASLVLTRVRTRR